MGLINKTALVKGASGGIGFYLTELFAGAGSKSVLVARAEDHLHHLPDKISSEFKNHVKLIRKDLSLTCV